MFAVKDQDPQKKAVASRSKGLDGQTHSGPQMREPVGSLQSLQRNLGNGYLQASKPTSTQMTTDVNGLRLQRACACGSTCAKCAAKGNEQRILQPKLTIGSPNDKYEQEADRVADQVMRMPEPAIQRRMDSEEEEEMFQRKVADQITPLVQRQVLPEMEEEEDEVIQTKTIDNQAAPSAPTRESSEVPSIVHEVLSSPGQPLDPGTRAFMEPRFGHDFSRIRIHNDLRATESAQAIDALAYTIGEHIVFGAGQYAPNTGDGKQLLAHELTHSMQQHHGQIHRKPRSVKIGKRTDQKQATLKALELAKLINTGKWKQENNEQLAHWLEFFEDIALITFISELEDAIGKKITAFDDNSQRQPRGLFETSDDKFDTTDDVNLIIPTSEAKVARGGFKVAYSAQIFEETSESTSVEVSNEVSGSGGLGIELPINKIAKFKFGGEAKASRRRAERDEKKTTNRSGRTILRSFTIQKLEREVMNYAYIKTYIGLEPGMLMAKGYTHTKTGQFSEIQHGFQIVDDSGGEPWGPFWNIYSGHGQVEGSALSHVWEVLTKEQRKIATDLVFGSF